MKKVLLFLSDEAVAVLITGLRLALVCLAAAVAAWAFRGEFVSQARAMTLFHGLSESAPAYLLVAAVLSLLADTAVRRRR